MLAYVFDVNGYFDAESFAHLPGSFVTNGDGKKRVRDQGIVKDMIHGMDRASAM